MQYFQEVLLSFRSKRNVRNNPYHLHEKQRKTITGNRTTNGKRHFRLVGLLIWKNPSFDVHLFRFFLKKIVNTLSFALKQFQINKCDTGLLQICSVRTGPLTDPISDGIGRIAGPVRTKSQSDPFGYPSNQVCCRYETLKFLHNCKNDRNMGYITNAPSFLACVNCSFKV